MARKSAIEAGILNDSAFYILSTVIEAKHGYVIMKTIDDLTMGSVTIGPASLYTTLKKLLDADLISRVDDQDETTKIYIITKKGMKVLETDIQRKKEMIEFARHFTDKKLEVTNEN